jgi:hexosaminidase
MKKAKYFSLLVLTLLLLNGTNSFADSKKTPVKGINIIPQPNKIVKTNGNFVLDADTYIYYDGKNKELGEVAKFLAMMIFKENIHVIPARVSEKSKIAKSFVLSVDGKLNTGKEGYILEITKNRINISSQNAAGVFYGVQTFRQLLPATFEKNDGKTVSSVIIPCLKIEDQPRFGYRGMHLDVSRHFFGKDFVKKYIDMIAMFKMNVFHWHLTDDNGWRLEIKKYPKLTEVCAWHVDRQDKPWTQRELQKEGEKATYGGFYTQDEVKEVIEYARQRHVEIIPEIEMPGHSAEIFAAYPQFSCKGEKLTVLPGTYWPNIDIFCAGNDSTFIFLQNILDEVCALFPSKYIHIGGDEADKTRWKECPKCQERIKKEGLKDENELQSYFIKRIEKYLISKNKKMIGWDEILEGGLAPEATVMSWRGLEGGIAAAKQKHDVIMTPTSYCYLDYYQGEPEFEPAGIGGYVTLKKVYSFEPVPAELNKEEQKYILGAQGNVWAEYIPTSSHAEYMASARMIALSEVDWSAKEARNWNSFIARFENIKERLKALNINYSEGTFRLDFVTKYNASAKKMQVSIESEQYNPEIRYTIDGSEPTANSMKYTKPFSIGKSAKIKAAIFRDGKLVRKSSEKEIVLHKAVGKKVELKSEFSERYKAAGAGSLVDGLRGTNSYNDGYWLGFQQNNMEAVIDLGSPAVINKISSTYLQNIGSWAFMPVEVVYLVSNNGKDYKETALLKNDIPNNKKGVVLKDFTQELKSVKARYIKVIAKSIGLCPEGHEGAGQKAWLFCDEIVVE